MWLGSKRRLTKRRGARRGETLKRLRPQVRQCRCIRRELHEGLVRLGRVSIIIVAGAPFEQLFWLGQRRRYE